VCTVPQMEHIAQHQWRMRAIGLAIEAMVHMQGIGVTGSDSVIRKQIVLQIRQDTRQHTAHAEAHTSSHRDGGDSGREAEGEPTGEAVGRRREGAVAGRGCSGGERFQRTPPMPWNASC